jgi:tetratricopeptide (TPR) repeat protein
VALAVTVCPSTGLGAKPAPAGSAAELATRAREAYVAGAFRQAVDLYKEAYEQRRDPTILFNLARCYEALGSRADLEASIEAYAGYLAGNPEAADRAAIGRHVDVLRQQIKVIDENAAAEAARLATRTPVPSPSTALSSQVAPLPPPTRASPAPFVAAGVGVIGIGAGAVLAVLARERHRQAVDEPSAMVAHQRSTAAQSFATGANVAFVAGGVFLAAGTTWAVWDWRSRSASSRRVAVHVGPAAVSLEARF